MLDDIGAKDDHAIMDLTSWDPNTLYDVLNQHHILRQQIPSPTSRLYYLCNVLTTLKLIRTYYKERLGHHVDKDGFFATNIGFNTLDIDKRPSAKNIESFVLKHDDLFLDFFLSLQQRLPQTTKPQPNQTSKPVTPPRTRLRPTQSNPTTKTTTDTQMDQPTHDPSTIPKIDNRHQPPIDLTQPQIPDPSNTYVHVTHTTKSSSPQSVTDLHQPYHQPVRQQYIPRGSNHQPIYDNAIPGTNDHTYPTQPNPYRDKHWEERGRRAPSPARTYPKRHPLPSTVKWNGEDRTFTKFDTAISAWLLSASMGYIDHPDFIQAYRDGGWNYAQHLATDISHQQFRYDNELLFGALLSSVQKRGSRRVEDLKHTRDGLRAWIELKDYFGGDNNPTLKMDRLRKELDQPWSTNFEGGFLGYLDHMAHIYNKMDIEDPKFKHHGPTNDEIRVTTIRNRFANTPYARVTYDYYEQMAHNNKFDVEEYINRLTRYYHHMENDLATYSKSHAHNVTHDSNNPTSSALVTRNPSIPHPQATSTRQINYTYNPPGNNPYRSSQRKGFLILDRHEYQYLYQNRPDILTRIREVRTEAQQVLSSMHTQPNAPPPNQPPTTDHPLPTATLTAKPSTNTTGPTQVPYQYPDAQAHYTSLDIPPLNDVDDQSTYDDNDNADSLTDESWSTIDPNELLAHIPHYTRDTHARNIRTINLSTETFTHVYATMRSDEHFSTTDGGADTMVLGNGWRFLEIYPNRTINVVGFDETTTKKYGCSVGTACAVINDVDGKPYLLIAHEAVQNKRSNTSLLSESQMRNHGLIVDSTSSKHIGIDGLPGTQSFYSPDKQLQFRFTQRAALMVLPHRPPTDDEIATLPHFEITSRQLWHPHDVYDEDTVTTTLDTSFDHVPSDIVRAQRTQHVPTPPEPADQRPVFHKNDDSTVSTHPSSFDFDDTYQFDFDDTTFLRIDFTDAYHTVDIAPNPHMQHDYHRLCQARSALLDTDATTEVYVPTNDPVITMPPLDNPSPATPDVTPSYTKPLPHYRPAFKVLELFKDVYPYRDDSDLLHGSEQLCSLTPPHIEPDDQPLQHTLQCTLTDPEQKSSYLDTLAHGLSHPTTIEPIDTTPSHAFHTSLDGGRFIPTNIVTTMNDHIFYDENFFDAYETIEQIPSYNKINNELPNDIIDEDTMINEHQFFTARQNSKPHDRLTRAFHLNLDKNNFTRTNVVDQFLDELQDRELFGYNVPFDSYQYLMHDAYREFNTHTRTTHTNYMLTRSNPLDAMKLQPYLGFRPLEVIRRTLEQTTQLARLATGLPMRRHVKALFPFLNRKRIDETVATDTFFSSQRDVSGAHCAQIFYGLRSHFMNIYPLRTEADGPQAFEDFARYEGLPNVIRSDNSKMQRYSQKLLTRLREWLVAAQFTEPHHPQQNPAELRAIRWIKKNIQLLRIRTGAPESVWYWMAKYLVDIHNVTADETLGWATPWSKRRGETPDISAFLQFRFYEQVYYLDPDQKFPGTKEKTGYWLGVADNVGDRLCFHILTTDTHRVIERSVVRSALQDPNRTLNFPSDDFEPTQPIDPDHRSHNVLPHNDHIFEVDDTDRDDSSKETEPMIRNRKRLRPPSYIPQRANEQRPFILRQRLRSDKRKAHLSKIIGHTTDILPPLSSTYREPEGTTSIDIETPDYAQCFRGINSIRQSIRDYVMALDAESDRHDDDYTTWNPLFIYSHRVRKHKGQTRSFQLRVGWQYHDPCWIDGDALRVQCPHLIIDYVHRNKFENLSDFKWVKKLTPEEETRLVHAFATSTQPGPKYKFGQLVPRNIAHAFEIDRMNNNTAWQDAMGTELKQINDYKTFRLLQKGEHLIDFQRIPYHFVFDVKFDLRKKARLVAGGNRTTPPKEDLYSGVVDLMTVRIGHMIAKANGLMVCAADIGNAFLYGKTREKVHIIAGREFGPLAGTPLIIDRGLYGLRSSSARFHEHLSMKLRAMGYRPSKADTDFWILDKGDHYEYVATYVDDVLVYSRDPMRVIRELQCDYILKGIGVPRYYLGGDILELDSAWQTGEETIQTALSAETYITNATSKYEQEFSTETQPFTFRAYRAPMDHTYHSEEDDSDLLTPRQASVYRGLIGSANWVVTLGRFDIAFAVNNLARYCMAPRQGHFEAALHLFGYLKAFPKGRILIDQQPYTKPDASFMDYDWTEFYPDAEEELPPDMPLPRGKPMTTICYVDADHAHDTITRRSVTGVLLFLNGMPVKWYSKRQKTVETSSYGSELVATRIAIELVQELRYKLRMLGVPIDRSTTMYGDNMAVVLNTTVPSSQLKKKHNAIAYHRIREAIAAKIVRFAHIPSIVNIADILTKPLPVDTFQRLVTPVLFREPPSIPVSNTITDPTPNDMILERTLALTPPVNTTPIDDTTLIPDTTIVETVLDHVDPEPKQPIENVTVIDLDLLPDTLVNPNVITDIVSHPPTPPPVTTLSATVTPVSTRSPSSLVWVSPSFSTM
jgi:hypothetical protein